MELKPCPFADTRMSHKARVRKDEIAYLSPATWVVICHCGATGPNRESAEEAAIAWNTRAMSAQPAPVGEPSEAEKVRP